MAGTSFKLGPDSIEAEAAASSTAYSPGLVAPENKVFYPALNGFRAIAVLGVFVHHYRIFKHPSMDWGWTGVEAFFVLSGFLITGILFDTRDSPRRYRNFYGRRMLRIFPLYYGVLLLLFLLTPVMHWRWHPALLMWPLYLGNYSRFLWLHDWQASHTLIDQIVSGLPLHPPLVIGIGHFWSLCVEEQFYLVWPCIVFLISDRVRLRNVCLGVSAACFLLRLACVFLVPGAYLQAELLNRATFLRADALLLGGALALMLRGPEAAWLLRQPKRWIPWMVGGFAAIELISILRTGHPYIAMGGSHTLTTAGYSLIDVFAALVILAALNARSLIYRVLVWKPLQQLGQISYGFYVFHDLLHDVYWRASLHLSPACHLSPENLTTVLGFAGTLLLSVLSYRFFESPMLRFKTRFTD